MWYLVDSTTGKNNVKGRKGDPPNTLTQLGGDREAFIFYLEND
jgi:hypothetical protein